jgi:hypothetical protein
MKNLIGRLKKIRHGNPVVIVSGLPRSGTSMVMQMLQAGGIEAATDSVREKDEDNPRGYFELEKVKHLAEEGDKSWLTEYRGRAVKVISYLLRELPRPLNYRVVFVTRDLGEILISQKKMLRRRGEAGDDISDQRMRMNFTTHIRQVRVFLSRAPNFETLFLDHRDIINRPGEAAARMNAFLGGELDEAAMTAAVDRTLYRNRLEKGEAGEEGSR